MVYKWITQCLLVEGHLRSAIYDLNRNEVHLVDPQVGKLRSKVEGKTQAELTQLLEEDEREWFEHLCALEIFMEVPSACFGHFLPLPIHFDSPKVIQTASIHENNDIPACLELLHSLNCFNVTLIVEKDASLAELLKKHFEKTDLRSLEIFIGETTEAQSFFDKIIDDYPVIQKIHTRRPSEEGQTIDQHRPTLALSIAGFMEAQVHHLYFNQRIHIDAEGYLHNAPSTPASPLHFSDLQIETAASQILSDVQVTQNWKAAKDLTDVCKACEFRYQCHDHREPAFRPADGLWYHPVECAYNPYIGKWRGQDGYMPLEACGIHTGPKGFWIEEKQLERAQVRAWSGETEGSAVL